MDLEQYRLIVESSPNMIWRSNLSTECDYFNRTWLEFTGHTMEEEYGFGWASGVHPDDFDRCVKIYLDNFKLQKPFEMDYRLKRYDGQYRWINDRGVPFYNEDNVFIGFIGSCMDVTEKIEGQRLKEMAQNDALCQTYNRQYSHQLLLEVFNQAGKEGLPLSILMMDIDSFKTVNDRYGHGAGDIVLTNVAAAAKKELRKDDILGRYGGDEFLIGLKCTSHESALVIAKHIRTAIEKTEIKVSATTTLKVSVSIGVKCLQGESTLDELINNADKKLYEAKSEGKNRVSG
ncbi:sensor domain-containing diguanylate cyclase [uncultured Sphaerochaeta sp.]|uniref:sensor domain-containing diguanylate cyclase n=1 Tax=uncultured Sphaerochaeta sp. TaxID=886478 RepID=UPI002AA669E6|nr:sensor domain-containing diguanylate cyclase [uncultured Sphaerochaeta sp.]